MSGRNSKPVDDVHAGLNLTAHDVGGGVTEAGRKTGVGGRGQLEELRGANQTADVRREDPIDATFHLFRTKGRLKPALYIDVEGGLEPDLHQAGLKTRNYIRGPLAPPSQARWRLGSVS